MSVAVLDQVRSDLQEARRYTLSIAASLGTEALFAPFDPIANPMAWEIGHIGWFEERWCLRELLGFEPLRSDGDALWDSSAVVFGTRYDLPLPDLADTLAYLAEVRALVLSSLESAPDTYFHQLVTFHEDMHGESLVGVLQKRGLTCRVGPLPTPVADGGWVKVAAGTYRIGASPDMPFVFDNEKWAHEVRVGACEVAASVVSCGEFLRFVEDGGYARRSLWTDDGWAWRRAAGAACPVYWKHEGGLWLERRFDQWLPVDGAVAMCHVNAYEAEAFATWAGARLPNEFEWEACATGLDIGHVWEWTSTWFLPYPGFSADPYKDYSEPWFRDHRVLRGRCRVTRPRLLRESHVYRNFFLPHRRDVFAGVRLCRDT